MDNQKQNLTALLDSLEGAERAFSKSLSEKYTPNQLFNISSEELAEEARKILAGFSGKIKSIFKNAEGQWEVPSVSLGEIILAGGKYLGARQENRDQVANTLVENYLKDKNNQNKDAALYGAVLNCRDGLGSIAMLKGFADRLTKLLYEDSKNMTAEDLELAKNGIQLSITASFEELKKTIPALGKEQQAAEKSIEQFQHLIENRILNSLESKIKELRALEAPKKPETGLSFSALKTAFNKAITSVSKTHTPSSKITTQNDKEDENTLDISDKQARDLVQMLKKEKEGLREFSFSEEHETMVNLATSIKNLSNKSLPPSERGTEIKQFLDRLSSAKQKAVNAADYATLKMVQVGIIEHIKENIDPDFTYNDPEAAKRPSLKNK